MQYIKRSISDREKKRWFFRRLNVMLLQEQFRCDVLSLCLNYIGYTKKFHLFTIPISLTHTQHNTQLFCIMYLYGQRKKIDSYLQFFSIFFLFSSFIQSNPNDLFRGRNIQFRHTKYTYIGMSEEIKIIYKLFYFFFLYLFPV